MCAGLHTHTHTHNVRITPQGCVCESSSSVSPLFPLKSVALLSFFALDRMNHETGHKGDAKKKGDVKKKKTSERGKAKT